MKFRYGMGLMGLESERTGKNGYDNDFLSYHAVFLTGVLCDNVLVRDKKSFSPS